MTEVTKEAAALANQICGCATKAQHAADVQAILAYRQTALATARAEAEALRDFVEDVAKQWLPGEPEPFDDFDPCLEDGYRIIVERARALTKGPTQ